MITKIKILILTVIIFAISVNSFAAFPVVTGDEPEPPKVVIKEGDRMKVEYRGITRMPYFIFLLREYNDKKVNLLFEVSGMHEWFENLFTSYERRNNRQVYDDYLIASVRRFNDFLAKSQENRDKVAEVIYSQVRKEWEEKQKKKRNKELLGNRKLSFASFNLGFGSELARKFEMTTGIGLMYFGAHATKSFSLGLSFNINFTYQEHYKNAYEALSIYPSYNSDKCGYLFLNGNFLMKFGKLYSYIMGIGGEIAIKLGGSDHWDYRESYYGVRFEHGFLYLSDKTDIGLYITIYVKMLERGKHIYDSSGFRINISSGIQFTLLLNLTGK